MVKLTYTIGLLAMSSTNNQQGENIYINDLTSKISNIIKSNDKNDFIKNYNEYHKKIKLVDDTLYSPSTLDQNTEIKMLFESLKEYSVLLDTKDITVEEYKNMADLVELIEKKIKSSTFEVKEL